MNCMKKFVQRVMHCPCGSPKIFARGLCAGCYTAKRTDAAYFGGLRETVLERDGYRCRCCGVPWRGKRSIVVHHRVPGVSLLHLMISLCPKCHAIVERTLLVISEMSPLLLELWREKHPNGQEQIMLDFSKPLPLPEGSPLFLASSSLEDAQIAACADDERG